MGSNSVFVCFVCACLWVAGWINKFDHFWALIFFRQQITGGGLCEKVMPRRVGQPVFRRAFMYDRSAVLASGQLYGWLRANQHRLASLWRNKNSGTYMGAEHLSVCSQQVEISFCTELRTWRLRCTLYDEFHFYTIHLSFCLQNRSEKGKQATIDCR